MINLIFSWSRDCAILEVTGIILWDFLGKFDPLQHGVHGLWYQYYILALIFFCIVEFSIAYNLNKYNTRLNDRRHISLNANYFIKVNTFKLQTKFYNHCSNVVYKCTQRTVGVCRCGHVHLCAFRWLLVTL